MFGLKKKRNVAVLNPHLLGISLILLLRVKIRKKNILKRCLNTQRARGSTHPEGAVLCWFTLTLLFSFLISDAVGTDIYMQCLGGSHSTNSGSRPASSYMRQALSGPLLAVLPLGHKVLSLQEVLF